MNISELYGKKIISTGGKKGYVISVNANKNKIECLVCADENEAEFKVDFGNITDFGSVLVYEDREGAFKQAKPVTLGRAGYDENGRLLGVVEDFVFKGGRLLSVIIGAKKYPAERIVLGDAVIVGKNTKLKGNVVKEGKIFLKKGTAVTDEVLEKAAENGEYIQTNLKKLG